jgi:hypothetical protein
MHSPEKSPQHVPPTKLGACRAEPFPNISARLTLSGGQARSRAWALPPMRPTFLSESSLRKPGSSVGVGAVSDYVKGRIKCDPPNTMRAIIVPAP